MWYVCDDFGTAYSDPCETLAEARAALVKLREEYSADPAWRELGITLEIQRYA